MHTHLLSKQYPSSPGMSSMVAYSSSRLVVSLFDDFSPVDTALGKTVLDFIKAISYYASFFRLLNIAGDEQSKKECNIMESKAKCFCEQSSSVSVH